MRKERHGDVETSGGIEKIRREDEKVGDRDH